MVELRTAYQQLLNQYPALLPNQLIDRLDLTLRFGVVHSAWIHKSASECSLGTGAAQVGKLLAIPGARFLVALNLELANESQADPFATLAAGPQLHSLRELTVHDQRVAFYRRGELLDPIWEAAPRLENLVLRGQCPNVHRFQHERLTSLTLSTHHLTADLIHTLINHELPALQCLDLSLKSAEEQTSIEDSVQEFIRN